MAAQPPRTLVCKVGGSLLDLPDLGQRLGSAFSADDCVALLAGGGELVEVLRGWQARGLVSEVEAHHLAMRALETTALRLMQIVPNSRLCASPEDVRSAWRDGVRAIVRADELFRAAPGWFVGEPRLGTGLLPQSWDVTSDTLAACLAIELQADVLVLAKSVDLHCGNDWELARAAGLVDACFPLVAATLPAVQWLNLRPAGSH